MAIYIVSLAIIKCHTKDIGIHWHTKEYKRTHGNTVAIEIVVAVAAVTSVVIVTYK